MLRKLGWLFVIVVAGVIVFTILASQKQAPKPQDGPVDRWAMYANPRFRVQFRYPTHWQPSNALDRDHYVGYNGFFTLSALNGRGLAIDDAMLVAVGPRTSPYGTDPKIDTLSLGGQDARLVTPSADQAPELNDEAMLIVKYSAPVQFGSEAYRYAVLWADKDHILNIAKTLTFISSGQSALGVISGTVSVAGSKAVGTFTDRKIWIYDETKTTRIKEVAIGVDGSYRVELDPGTYVVDINHIGLDRTSDVPTTVDLAPGQETQINIAIDNGIR